MQASIGTEICAWLHVRMHATSYHSLAVKKLRLPNASQHRHYDKCQVACVTACNIISQFCCDDVRLPNASQQRHYDMCRVACAKHATSYHSLAVNKFRLPSASQHRHYDKCQVACVTACNIISQFCCEHAALAYCKPAKAL